MVTRFGRELRNIRIQRHELLYDMAKRLNISTVVLSRAENGDSKISEELLNSIEKLYALNEQESEQLKKLAYESNKQLETKQTIKYREPKQHKKPEEERTYKDYFTSLHTTESSIKDEYTALGAL